MISVFIFFVIATVVITMWGLGLRSITDQGKLLYFLRKPFEEKVVKVTVTKEDFDKMTPKERHGMIVAGDKAYRNVRIPAVFWAKPIITCIWCFPSFWGTIIYFSLYSMTSIKLGTFDLIFFWVVSCVSASFWSGFFWLLKKKIER